MTSMRPLGKPAATLAALAVAAATLSGIAPATAAPSCARQQRIDVPHAEKQVTACLDDLTTAGTVASGHTNPDDWAGLNAAGTTNPTGVPGIQVDGYFPDTSTSNTNNGWNHDAQFVIRLPEHWNGKLVVSGAPGTRRQYANDFLISDWVLARGYAFASTDKGNNGASFYDDGSSPGGSIREWNRRVTQLTRATKAVVAQRYGRSPKRTYMFGISNGGYLTRWQLENRPALYDGGLDWEGTLFRAAGPNLLTYLPTALKNYPAYAATGDEQAHQAMLDAGFEPGSEFLWPFHYSYYWDLTQRVYREELDPTYDGDLKAGVPFCASGTPTCDADYDYAARPQAVHDAVRSVAADRQDRQADAHRARHPRRAAADPHRLRRLRPAGRPGRQRPAAPLLPGRRRHPRRRPLHRLPGPAAPAPALRAYGVHGPDRVGGARRHAAEGRDLPAAGERRPAEQLRAVAAQPRSTEASSPGKRSSRSSARRLSSRCRPWGTLRSTPASRSVLRWWERVDLGRSPPTAAQATSSSGPSARSRTISRREGSLSANSTSVSTSSDVSGCGRSREDVVTVPS